MSIVNCTLVENCVIKIGSLWRWVNKSEGFSRVAPPRHCAHKMIKIWIWSHNNRVYIWLYLWKLLINLRLFLYYFLIFSCCCCCIDGSWFYYYYYYCTQLKYFKNYKIYICVCVFNFPKCISMLMFVFLDDWLYVLEQTDGSI